MLVTRSIAAAVSLAALLSGCISLGSLEEQEPSYSGELKGNYYDLAECAKARQSKFAPMIRIELLHDKPAKEATVTWNHDFGAMHAFVFKAIDPNHTKLLIYTGSPLNNSLVDLTNSCGEA